MLFSAEHVEGATCASLAVALPQIPHGQPDGSGKRLRFVGIIAAISSAVVALGPCIPVGSSPAITPARLGVRTRHKDGSER